MIEFPFCAKLFRGTDSILRVSENKTFKAATYAVFALIIWLSAFLTPSTILVAATTLTISSILYALSVMQGETGGTALTNPENIASASIFCY
jgi:hypothetical protein